MASLFDMINNLDDEMMADYDEQDAMADIVRRFVSEDE